MIAEGYSVRGKGRGLEAKEWRGIREKERSEGGESVG